MNPTDCPFCNTPSANTFVNPRFKHWIVMCENDTCGWRSPKFDTEGDAVREWERVAGWRKEFKRALKMCRKAWVILDYAEPNNLFTDKMFQFLVENVTEVNDD